MSSLTEHHAYSGEETVDGAGERLRQLRSLLLAPEQRQILAIRGRLDDPGQKSEELSECLAEAVTIRSGRDRKLQAALQPMIEDALRIAATRDPGTLAAVLSPILGRAVLGAIGGALRRGAGSVNHLLMRTLTLESWRWRRAARRTGQPLGVITLTRSRRYRVEQVFLVHRASGLVIGHAGRDADRERDAELVSAIQAVSDGGNRNSSAAGGLEVLTLGERTLWLRHGPLALLAAVVSGRPPAALGQLFASEIDAIHQEFAPRLRAFHGESLPLAGLAGHLRGCLLGGGKAGARQSYAAVFGLAAVVLISAGFMGAGRIAEDRSWSRYLDRLRNEPGIVVIESQHHWSTYAVRGLRDPLAADPQELLSGYGIPAAKISARWEPYLSMDPRFAAARRVDQANPARN